MITDGSLMIKAKYKDASFHKRLQDLDYKQLAFEDKNTAIVT